MIFPESGSQIRELMRRKIRRMHITSDAIPPEAPRHSTRIRAQIPIRVASLAPTFEFSAQCHTLVVNTEGCGVRLTQPLEPGLPVSLDELPCGKNVRAHVANCVPLGTGDKYWLVGLALEEQGNIWCLRPVPADWGTDPQPAFAAVPTPQKSNQWPYSFFSRKGEAHPGKK